MSRGKKNETIVSKLNSLSTIKGKTDRVSWSLDPDGKISRKNLIPCTGVWMTTDKLIILKEQLRVRLTNRNGDVTKVDMKFVNLEDFENTVRQILRLFISVNVPDEVQSHLRKILDLSERSRQDEEDSKLIIGSIGKNGMIALYQSVQFDLNNSRILKLRFTKVFGDVMKFEFLEDLISEELTDAVRLDSMNHSYSNNKIKFDSDNRIIVRGSFTDNFMTNFVEYTFSTTDLGDRNLLSDFVDRLLIKYRELHPNTYFYSL